MLWLKKRLTSLFGGKSRNRDRSIDKHLPAGGEPHGHCSLSVGSSKSSSLRKPNKKSEDKSTKCRCQKIVSQCNLHPKCRTYSGPLLMSSFSRLFNCRSRTFRDGFQDPRGVTLGHRRVVRAWRNQRQGSRARHAAGAEQTRPFRRRQ